MRGGLRVHADYFVARARKRLHAIGRERPRVSRRIQNREQRRRRTASTAPVRSRANAASQRAEDVG